MQDILELVAEELLHVRIQLKKETRIAKGRWAKIVSDGAEMGTTSERRDVVNKFRILFQIS